MKTRWIWIFAVVLLLAGCGSDDPNSDSWDLGDNNRTDAGPDTNVTPDTDVVPDTEVVPDATVPPDAGDTGPGCLERVPAQHRSSAASCDHQRSTIEPNPDPNGPMVECTEHADCTEGENGRCVGNSHDGWHCTYDLCFEDSDCSGSRVCECGGGFRSDHNVCLPGNCQTDADCGENGFCSPSFGSCGDYSGVVAYYCHTCEDECVDDSDCADMGDGSGWGDPYCMYNETVGHWTCSDSQCAG